MNINISPVVRVSFGLIMLTLSILFVGDWMGLIPNSSKIELENRKHVSESLAIQFSSLAQSGDFKHVRTSMQALVDRNENVLSAAFHSSYGEDHFQAGDHSRHWTLKAGEPSTKDQVVVPIFRGEDRWGSVEVRFAPTGNSWLPSVLDNSFILLVIFVSGSGFLLYVLFLKRVLRQLDPSKVVPQRVSAAFNALAEGVLILDEKGHIILANRSFLLKAGEKEGSLVGTKATNMNWSPFQSSGKNAKYSLPWDRVLASGESLTGDRISINKGADRQRSYTVNCTPIRDEKNVIKGVISTFDDVTELEKKNDKLRVTLTELKQSKSEIEEKTKELELLATRDPLTNCLNRRSFNEKYSELYEDAMQGDTTLVALMVDIDHFKRVNDNYGHSMGDKVIQFVADTVQKNIRQCDLLARYGGEEFCLILHNLSVEQAVEIAERMRKAIKKGDPKRYTSTLKITASFGVALLRKALKDKEELVNNADSALYLAKESGRNKVVVWGEEQADKANNVAQIEDKRAEKAIENAASEKAATVDSLETGAQLRIEELERIAEEKARELDRYFTYDTLTDLPTRNLFVDRVEQGLLRAKRKNCVMAVLSLGIADLGRINDTLGHEFAEELLRETAARLQHVLRSTDTVSLLSGDDGESTISKLNEGEFGLLLSSTEDDKAITWIVKRIFDALQEPLYIDDQNLSIVSNIGIGVYPTDAVDAKDLIKKASISRYFAEQLPGHNNVEYFSQEINQSSKNQLVIESELSEAVDNNEFELFYQPKVDLNTGNICGFESLIRWRHPVRGLLTPNEFIDIAERTRLINIIGEWVLRESCKQLTVFDQCSALRPSIAVNLSPVQLTQPDLVERVLQIIDETGINPNRLELELTESSLMENMEFALDSLRRLQEFGIKISIDDFGTGYSALSYLRSLPVDCLKVDRCFVADIDTSSDDHAIIVAIVNMAQALGLTVVAEGAETREQLDVLIAMSCDIVQGYLFSRPVPADQAGKLLSAPSGMLLEMHSMVPQVSRVR